MLKKMRQCFHSINIQSSCVSTCCVKDAEMQVEIHERKKKQKHHKKNHDDREKEKESGT